MTASKASYSTNRKVLNSVANKKAKVISQNMISHKSHVPQPVYKLNSKSQKEIQKREPQQLS